MEKSARLRNLLIAVKLSEGLIFSATFRKRSGGKNQSKKIGVSSAKHHQ
jgi:hypothetical protein